MFFSPYQLCNNCWWQPGYLPILQTQPAMSSFTWILFYALESETALSISCSATGYLPHICGIAHTKAVVKLHATWLPAYLPNPTTNGQFHLDQLIIVLQLLVFFCKLKPLTIIGVIAMYASSRTAVVFPDGYSVPTLNICGIKHTSAVVKLHTT